MSNFEKEHYDKASHIISSSYRRIVYYELLEGPKTTSDIAKNTKLQQAHSSRAIQELREQNIVELLVSEEVRKGRYYGVTDEGEELKSMVEMLKEDE